MNYPAKFAGVIAGSAIDSSDLIASFSSRGAAVDVAVPGLGVFSTDKGSSMASPHSC